MGAASVRRRGLLAFGLFVATLVSLLLGTVHKSDVEPPRSARAPASDVARQPELQARRPMASAATGPGTEPGAGKQEPAASVSRTHFRGLLVDAESGLGVAGARVYQVSEPDTPSAASDGGDMREVRSNERGEFEIAMRLDRPDLRLGILAPGYHPLEVPPSTIAGAAAGENRVVHLEAVPARGVVRGRVVDEQDRSLAGATIWCRPALSRVPWSDRESASVRPLDAAPWTTASDTNGRFELRGLAQAREYLLVPRLQFHAPLGDQRRRTRPDQPELVIRMQRVALIAWRCVRDGQVVPVPPIAVLVVAGAPAVAPWDGALPMGLSVDALRAEGWSVHMLTAAKYAVGAAQERVGIQLKSLRGHWNVDGLTVMSTLGEFTRHEHELQPVAVTEIELVAAFVGGKPFSGVIDLTSTEGESTAFVVRNGRAEGRIPRDARELRASVGGAASHWWESAIELQGGGPLGPGPLTCRVRGGRIELDVRTADGDSVDTFDLEVRLLGNAKHGWQPDYPHRLRAAGEAGLGAMPFVWLPPGTHGLRVNHARLGLGSTDVSVPEDGSSARVQIELDPERAIDLGKGLSR